MTFYTTELNTPAPRAGVFNRMITWLASAIEAHGDTMSRRDQIEALEAKTDAELAEMGLNRDQIAYHVFKDLFYA